MREKATRKPKLSDAERHTRFVEMAAKVGASNDQKDFDKAFGKVISAPKPDKAVGRPQRRDRAAKR